MRLNKTAVKMGVCGTLTALALITAASAAAVSRTEKTAEAAVTESYVLRDYGGRVAVYYSGGNSPITVTGIETGTLREGDRALIEDGLYVSGRERLLLLLEDLGS